MQLIGALRQGIASLAPRRRTVGADALAGLPCAVSNVSDGMASAVLVGVNPAAGLYAGILGPVGGGLTAGTRLMVVTTTTAAALAANSALSGVADRDRLAALLLLTILAGVAMIAAGCLRLGRYTRFVSVSVMTGFLTGVAANIALGQLANLTGTDVHGGTALAKAIDLLTHLSRIDGGSLAIGLAATVMMLALGRTRLANVAAVVALVSLSVVAWLVGGIETVADVGAIPSGVPTPHLPRFGLISPNLIIGALAIAVIVLVQGAGVSESAPNPDGTAADPNRDFIAQGVGNVASGLFGGQPVGGSVGSTAMSRSVGARTRWASIFAGLWMLAIVVVFAGVVGHVAVPILAAILILAAIRSLRVEEIDTLLHTSWISAVAMLVTFVATLLLPVTTAVGIGVALSLLMQINREALDLSVMQLTERDGQTIEQPAPDLLPSEQVTLLEVYGTLYHAGARTLQARLPDPSLARRPVVVLRLRGRTRLGATAMTVIETYAKRLAAAGGRLYLSGVDPALIDVMQRSGRLADDGPVVLEPATEVLGASSRATLTEAEQWLAQQRAEPQLRTEPR